MYKKITCLTYQSFPSEKANSIATILTLKYLKKLGYDVELIFPKRRKDSSDDLNIFKKFYNLDEDITVKMLPHNLPFEKFEIFKNLLFNISHFLWSFKAVLKIREDKSTSFYTRSDWVLLFLAFKGHKVVFECHQRSKLKKLIFYFVKNKKNVLVIFINSSLLNDFSYNGSNYIVLNSAYDEDEFSGKNIIKIPNQVVFIGHLLRFEKERNINFLIHAFQDPRLQKYKLILAGGPEEYSDLIQKQIIEQKINNIEVLGWLNRIEVVDLILQSDVGILINSENSIHSREFTSPTKYFEYLRGGLKVLAVDFSSHKNLPLAENITFFSNDNKEDFIKKLLSLKSTSVVLNNDIEKFSYLERAKNIVARLEGLEPPTV